MGRPVLLAVVAMLLAGCLAGTVDLPEGPDGLRTVDDAVTAPRRGVAVIGGDTETSREAARSLAAPLAAECRAEPLGVARSAEECLAAARERGLDGLVTCRVIEYDPYDPARLVVGVTLDAVGGDRHVSAREAMTLGRSTAGEAAGSSKRDRCPVKTVEIDLGAPSKGLIRAYARDAGLGESPDGLLEAEILLRDPARFFRFAAEQIAAETPAAE